MLRIQVERTPYVTQFCRPPPACPVSSMLVPLTIFFLSWALISYTYFVFPVLMASLARFYPRAEKAPEEGSEGELPTVAVVVAAYNEERFIEAKIRNTWQIDYPPDRLTLVIGSDGSSDATPQLLKSAPHPRLHATTFVDRRGKVSVINDLMSQVDADLVILSDANTMLAPDAVRKLVRHFRDPKVGCVNGALSLEHNGGVSGEGLYWKYELWLKTNESRLGFVIGCYGGILALRRELYQPLPASTIVEDFVLTLRIMEQGRIVRFDPEAHATEPASASSRAEWDRKVRIGAGDYQALMMTKRMLHPRYGMRAFAYLSHKVLRWYVPFFLLIALICNAGLVIQRGLSPVDAFTWFLALQLGGIFLSALVYHLPEGVGTPAWMRPISFFYLMNYGLLCGFVRWVRGRQPVTWKQAARQASGEAL